jgi:hypothetical protein
MIQQSPGAGNFTRTRVVMEDYYIICQYSTTLVLNDRTHVDFSVSQYSSDIIMVPCSMNSATRTPFRSQLHLLPSFWQTDNLCLNILDCLLNMCAPSTLDDLK